MSEDKWELYYWSGLGGRGMFVRLVFEEAGVEYVMRGESREEIRKLIIDGELDGFHHFAPPVIKKGNFTLSQTPVICQYLGKQYGFFPDSEEDQWRANQLNCSIHDFIAEGRLCFHAKDPVGSYYDQTEYTQPFIDKFIRERLPRHLKFLESALSYNNEGEGFVVGDKMTYVDLGLLHVLRAAEAQFEDAWNKADYIPKLKAFKKRMEARPRLKAFFESDRYVPFEGNSMM